MEKSGLTVGGHALVPVSVRMRSDQLHLPITFLFRRDPARSRIFSLHSTRVADTRLLTAAISSAGSTGLAMCIW